MTYALSRRSEMLRTDAAYGLAVLLREICEKAIVFTFSNDLLEVPPRQGFALRDALETSQPHNATYLGKALEKIREKYDRIIVITDGQAHDRVPRLRDQCGQLQKRRWLWRVDAHRRLKRSCGGVHPRLRANGCMNAPTTDRSVNAIAWKSRPGEQCVSCLSM